jgi:hypothetical protein
VGLTMTTFGLETLGGVEGYRTAGMFADRAGEESSFGSTARLFLGSSIETFSGKIRSKMIRPTGTGGREAAG